MTPLSHILIADSVWRRIEWPSATRPHLLLGSVAPDAYRADPASTFRDTHFRSHQILGQRGKDFLGALLRPALSLGSDEEQAFWLGWLSHLTADLFWRRLVRQDLSEVWRDCRDADPDRAADARERFRLGCDAADRELFGLRTRQILELQQLLRRAVPDYPLGPMNHQLLDRWVDIVCTEHLPPADPGPVPQLKVSVDFMSRAVEVCSEEAARSVTAELERMQRRTQQMA